MTSIRTFLFMTLMLTLTASCFMINCMDDDDDYGGTEGTATATAEPTEPPEPTPTPTPLYDPTPSPTVPDMVTFLTTYNHDWTYSQCYSAFQTSDNGYVILGSVWNYGGGSVMKAIKTDYLGDEQWSLVRAGFGPETGLEIQQTSDGGFIICGFSGENKHGHASVMLMKLSGVGELLWQRLYNTDQISYGYSIAETSDSGFIVAGYVYLDTMYAYLLRVDRDGNVSWEKTLTRGSGFYKVIQADDGGFLACGSDNGNKFLFKCDAFGNQVLWKRYGYGSATDLKDTHDTGYVLLGTTGDAVKLYKLDRHGNISWSKFYNYTNLYEASSACFSSTCNGAAESYLEALSVAQTADAGYLLVIAVTGYGMRLGTFLVKTGVHGEIEWIKNGFFNQDLFISHANYGQQTSDGGYFFCGSTWVNWDNESSKYFCLAKTDEYGDIW